jgi:spermidine/putrescine ABC transporter ATP-binding subunit
MSMFDIELISVSKQFGSYRAVDDINLKIPRGEFVSLLGPSGCGKTTTLNMIAGFESPSDGEIRIRQRSQAGVPPEGRHIGLVFQNYALFPHMTVFENVAFGLKMQGKSREEIQPSVMAALKSVHLTGFEARYPKELSGGQQQRTALARAIAPRPSLLLLDEPPSNLDLKLREAMRVELKEIQEQLGMTFVYVTHDQEEAMAMSDRVVVMHKGTVAQQGMPADIYGRPRTSFVADFIGKSNIFPVTAAHQAQGRLEVVLDSGGLSLTAVQDQAISPTDARFCCIRPEAVRIVEPGEPPLPGANRLDGQISKIVNLGAHLEVWVAVSAGQVVKALVRSTRLQTLKTGAAIKLSIAESAVQLLES